MELVLQTGRPLILYINENLIAKVHLSFRNQKKEAAQGTNALVTSNLLCVRTVGGVVTTFPCQLYSLILRQQKLSRFLACVGLNRRVLQV